MLLALRFCNVDAHCCASRRLPPDGPSETFAYRHEARARQASGAESWPVGSIR
jgi:hypothetical protein